MLPRGFVDAVGTTLSSYDVVDRIFASLGDTNRFPNLRKVLLTGFSAAGLAQIEFRNQDCVGLTEAATLW